MQLLIAAVALLLCVFVFLRHRNSKRNKTERELPPGPFLPTFARGNFVDTVSFRKLQRKYGDVVSCQILGETYVFLNSYEAIREAFVTHGDAFTGRPSNAILNCTQQGCGLIFTEGEIWRTHRRFLLSVLKDFGFGKQGTESIIQEELLLLADRFEENAKDAKPVVTGDRLSGAVANVICALVFGERCSEDPEFREILRMIADCAEHIGPLVLTMSKYLRILEWIPGDPFYVKSLMGSIKHIDAYVGRKLQLHKQTFERDRPRDYIDMYLREMADNRNLFTEDQLQRIIFELFIAGMDSTSTMLNWSIYFMARYPDIQKKVRDEIESNLDKNSVPKMSDKLKLKFTSAVLCEVQRCAILVPFGGARRSSRDTVLHGYTIPKDAIVSAPQLTVHKDSRLWPFPDRFEPENFIDPATQSLRNTEYLVTFSMGKRNCLGESLANQELFLFFTGLMQRFEFTAVSLPDADERFLCLPERRPPAFSVSLRSLR